MIQKVRTEKILKYLESAKSSDKKLILVDVYDGETGELLEEQIPILKDKIIDRKLKITTVEPYVRLSMNKLLNNKYYQYFTQMEKSYIFDLIRCIDAFGRIKYGDNYQQYCRTTEDFSKVINVSYGTLRKSLIPKLKKYDVIRTIKIEKGSGYIDEQFISFNPALVVNGVYWDRWTVLTWRDVIEEFKLLTNKEIKEIIGSY